ncbi:MAG: hypothetical protein PHW73_02280 [Atribacterota bacterium]|nr:hypothetical protein [Atribacterota bacterium]
MVKKTTPAIKLTLDIEGEIFSVETDNFNDAFDKLFEDSFGKIKTWGVFKLEMDGKKAEVRMRPLPIKRAINSKFPNIFARSLLEKRLKMALKK